MNSVQVISEPLPDSDRTVRVDQRVLAAGTTLRFVLLLGLFLAASVVMMPGSIVFKPFLAEDPENNGLGCMLAAGVDPDAGHLANHLALVRNEKPLQDCFTEFVTPLPWWSPLAAVGLLVVIAAAHYWWYPAWRAWRRRLVPVEEVDAQGDLLPLLTDLVRLARPVGRVRFVVDPGALTTSAVVFGRAGTYTVCLHGGLVARRRTDPDGFRTVVLHELAHLRNRDVDITYATSALWRVFVVGVLVPYAASQTIQLVSGLAGTTSLFWRGAMPMIGWNLLLSGFLVVLTYLARADILRTREIYADLDASAWGANLQRRLRPARNDATTGKVAQLWQSYLDLWRTHPRRQQRVRALGDPAPLFGASALTMFLTGAAGIITAAGLPDFVAVFAPNSVKTDDVDRWLAAVFIGTIMGIAVWRAVVHAALTQRPAPSGLRAGLGLGCGLVAGELVLGRMSGNHWWPANPAVLLLPLVAAIILTWWTTQSADLVTRNWSGRRIGSVMAVSVALSSVVFGVVFDWWAGGGYVYGFGLVVSPHELGQLLQQSFPAGPALPDSAMSGSVVSVLQFVLDFAAPSFVVVAAVLWLLPLLLWTMPHPSSAPGWVRRALPDVEEPQPPADQRPRLRTIIGMGALGGVTCWAAAVLVALYMHTWQPPPGQRGGWYVMQEMVLLIAAVSAAAVLGAVLSAVTVNRYRLLAGLIAAGVAMIVGLAGEFVLMATDGCVTPMSMLASSCHWRPTAAWYLGAWQAQIVLATGMYVSAAAVLLVVMIGKAVRFVSRTSADRTDWSARTRTDSHRRRSVVFAGCAAAAAVIVALNLPSGKPSQFDSAALIANAANPSTSKSVRAMQVGAWFVYGGKEQLLVIGNSQADYSHALKDLGEVVATDEKWYTTHQAATLRNACVAAIDATVRAETYFPLPDPYWQTMWTRVLEGIRKGSTDCRTGVDNADISLLEASANELVPIIDDFGRLIDWLGPQIDANNALIPRR